MKAVTCHSYGAPEVLQVTEVNKPVPMENEILIRIHATAVNTADWRMRKADPFAVRFFFGLTKPKYPILGGVFSGTIESIGSGVTKFQVGDEVFGSSASKYGFGAYAEYKCLPENGVVDIKPRRFRHEEAAVIPFGGTTALHFLKQIAIQPGHRVLIYGASGAVGSSMIQLVKQRGAHITAVCGPSNADLVRNLGAEIVLDYSRNDLEKATEKFDVVIECVGKISLSQCMKHVKPKGQIALVSAGLSDMLFSKLTAVIHGIRVVTGVIQEGKEDLHYLKQLMEQGKLRPVIDRTYSLEDIRHAHVYAEKGHKKGNIAIRIGAN